MVRSRLFSAAIALFALSAAALLVAAAGGALTAYPTAPLGIAMLYTLAALAGIVLTGGRATPARFVGLALAALLAIAIIPMQGRLLRQRSAARLDAARAALVGSATPRIDYRRAANLDAASAAAIAAGDRTMVLVFWAPWSAPSVDPMVALEELWRERRDELLVVGLTRPAQGDVDETLARVESYARTVDISYPLLVVDDATVERFRAESIPTLVLSDTARIRHYATGEDALAAIVDAAGLAPR